MAQEVENDIILIKNEIQFFASGSSNTVTLAAPTSLTSNVSFPLPTNNPSAGDIYVFSTSGEWQVDNSQEVLEVYNISDEKSSGTNGGTFTSGSWQTRTLNTITSFPTGGTNVTLSSNQFSVSAGTYLISARAPANDVNNHKIRLRDVTNNVTVLNGSSEQTSLNGVDTSSIIDDIFTINNSTTFEIQHQCQTTENTDGFGNACGFGVNEVYTVVNLLKLE